MEYGLIGLIVLVLDIVALVSIAGAAKSAGWKVLWALIVIFLPLVGMILYFLIGKKT